MWFHFHLERLLALLSSNSIVNLLVAGLATKRLINDHWPGSSPALPPSWGRMFRLWSVVDALCAHSLTSGATLNMKAPHFNVKHDRSRIWMNAFSNWIQLHDGSMVRRCHVAPLAIAAIAIEYQFGAHGFGHFPFVGAGSRARARPRSHWGTLRLLWLNQRRVDLICVDKLPIDCLHHDFIITSSRASRLTRLTWLD